MTRSTDRQQPETKSQVFISGSSDIRTAQRRLLSDIVEKNRHCHYLNHHDVQNSTVIENWSALPFMTYDDVAGFDDYWTESKNFSDERLLAYFLTSGSSSNPKKIPVTASLVKQKADAFGVYWDRIYTDHPNLKSGKIIANFADSGHSARSANGVLEVAETTFWNQRMQGFQSASRWPLGRHLGAIDSADLRYYAAVRLSLQGALHCMMSLNPSTLVQFCNVLETRAENLIVGLRRGDWGHEGLDANESLPEKLTAALAADEVSANRLQAALNSTRHEFQLRDVWPSLELIICWQSNLVEPYLRLLRRHCDGVAFRDYITQSSECIIAIPMNDNTSGGLLAYNSHYFEFIAEEDASQISPKAIPAWQVEPGKKYEVVVTTGGGLYRYRTSDCIAVDGFVGEVPRISFQYRLGKTSSITGEKLTEQQILAVLQKMRGEYVTDVSQLLFFPRTGDQPHYGIMLPITCLEFEVDSEKLSAWLNEFDHLLGECNGEYKDKRATHRLGAPRLILVVDDDLKKLHQSNRAAHVSDEQYKPGVLWRQHDLDADLKSAREYCAN